MFVPQWPNNNNDDDDVQSALPSLSNGDSDTDNELKKEESDATFMNDNGGALSAEDSTSKKDDGTDMMATNNNNNHASTTTTTEAEAATEQSELKDEGIEISSLMVSNNTNLTRDKQAEAASTPSSATEYDMALQGGSSSSMDEEEDADEAMYACQMWTANFPDHNNDDITDTANNNPSLSDGIESAFATFGGGDIWSTEAFALPSPLHDLLSSNAPLTLTELLAQDELLQELRGCEVKLVEYFGRGEVVADLVECVFQEVPYENEVGGRERWCSEEVVRRERRRELREERRKKEMMELERVGSCDDVVDDDMDEDEKVHPKSKLFVSSPREDGEEPNVETQWISPAVSPDKTSQKAGEGGGGGWLFNRDDDDELGDEEDDQRTPEEEYDLRFIRYPYMACEVLCSEVGTTLDVLVDGYIDVEEIQEVIHTKEGDDGVEGILTPTPFVVEEFHDVDIANNGDNNGVSGAESQLQNPLQPRGNDSVMFQPQEQEQLSKKRILDLIFSVLIDTPPASLDDRRAGYLEKLLVVLFRRRSQTMAEYMNTSLILTRKSAPMSNQMQSSSYNSFGQLGGLEHQQQQPSSLIEKYPSPNAPPMLMCALLDHIHSHSVMHVIQRLLVPSPQRQQGNSKENASNTSNGNESENSDLVATASSEIDNDDDNPFSATNNDFMNAINQMNGNQQISLHDMDDEDVDDEDDLEDDLTHLFQCDWSEKPHSVLVLLLDRLEGWSKSFLVEYGFPVGYSDDDSSKDRDVEKDVMSSCSRHASEILITIIQNSSLTSPLMISISSDPALKRVLDIISSSKSNEPGDESSLVPHDSKMTYAIMMLESLVLQLGGYGAAGTEGGALDTTRAESSQTNLSEIGPHTPPPLASMTVDSLPPDASKADTLNLGSHLPTLLNELSSLLTHPVTKTWLAPAQYTQGEPRPLLGTSRLRILRLVEALVLLGDASVDFDLQHSNILKHCIDLFWEFEWCSMLHQSVANFVVHVFEGGEGRLGLQEYFIEKCHLIERLMDSFSDEEMIGAVESGSGENNKYDGNIDDGNGIDVVAPVSEEDVDSAMEQESECLNDDIPSQQLEAELIQETLTISGKNGSRQMRKGNMGHIIIMCQALANASSNTGDDVIDASEGNESDFAEKEALTQLHSAPGQQNEISVRTSSNPSQIYCIIRRTPALFEKWQQFTLNTLALEMSVQSVPLGGQQKNATDQGETATTSDSLTQLTSTTNDNLDDLSSEPSGHLIFGGNGAAVGDIDMDENDLDIAVSMMEHLSLPPSNGESEDSGQSRGHNRCRALSKESNVGHNFGSVIPTTTEFKDYVYDDPLGGVHAFDNEDDDGENVENGGSEDGNNIMSDAMVVIKDEKETDSTSSDESSVEEDQGDDDEDDDVPVMDLFAGNVPFENGGISLSHVETDGDGGWANFDSLDADLSQTKGEASKNSNGEDPFSFSKTPFDFVDTIEEGE